MKSKKASNPASWPGEFSWTLSTWYPSMPPPGISTLCDPPMVNISSSERRYVTRATNFFDKRPRPQPKQTELIRFLFMNKSCLLQTGNTDEYLSRRSDLHRHPWAAPLSSFLIFSYFHLSLVSRPPCPLHSSSSLPFSLLPPDQLIASIICLASLNSWMRTRSWSGVRATLLSSPWRSRVS